MSSNPIKGSLCFLKQESLHSLLSTGWFQEWIQAWWTFHNWTYQIGIYLYMYWIFWHSMLGARFKVFPCKTIYSYPIQVRPDLLLVHQDLIKVETIKSVIYIYAWILHGVVIENKLLWDPFRKWYKASLWLEILMISKMWFNMTNCHTFSRAVEHKVIIVTDSIPF